MGPRMGSRMVDDIVHDCIVIDRFLDFIVTNYGRSMAIIKQSFA